MSYKNDLLCEACQKGKQIKNSFTNKNVSTSRPLQLLHLDLFGPTRTVSADGKRYGLVIVDDYSRWTWVIDNCEIWVNLIINFGHEWLKFLHFTIVFNEIIKKLTSSQFLIGRIQKKKISSALKGYWCKNWKKKALKKSWKKWTARLVHTLGLVRRKPIAKPKGMLSMKVHTKREVSMKSKLPRAFIRRRKQKGKTHRVLELSKACRGNPPSLAIPPSLSISHPTPSSIHISPWSVKSLMAMRGKTTIVGSLAGQHPCNVTVLIIH